MILFGEKDLTKSIELGKEAELYISSKFIKPMRLEFEKVYFPYLLLEKKRYAGLIWTKPDNYDTLDQKGIESKRRDNCLMISKLMHECLKKILIDKNIQSSIELVKKTISNLLTDKINIEDLVISKSLSKTEYISKQPHDELVKKIKIRIGNSNPNAIPHLGDRIPYVIIDGQNKKNISDRAENPDYAMQHNLPIDHQYYLDHQLKNPLTAIFNPIIGETKTKELFNGSHTRHIVKRSISESCPFGITNYFKKQKRE